MLRTICASIGVLWLLAGCALTRGELDIRVEEVPNPDAGMTVKIMEVADRREFQVNPRDPSIPSLKEDEVNDRSIERRAIARKRGGFGQAFGDILLPEGRTVGQLTKEALVKALRESGVKVLSEGEAGYETARPLRAEISQFWAWFTPGFWEIALQYEATVMLKGDWPVAETDREIEGKARLTGQIASTNEWRQVITQGIDNLIENAKRAIRSGVERLKREPARVSRSTIDGVVTGPPN